MANLVGQTLGQYQILEEIHSAENTVYKGFQASMNRYVAVKVLGSAQAGNPAFGQQFQRDMQFIAGLEHPNLLTILDYGQQDGELYLVTRYIEGGTLQDRLGQGGYARYTGQQAYQLIQPIADALNYLHTHGAVHGNLKPANILIDSQGRPLLTDFGYTQGIDVSQQENVYLSPEQIQGGTVDARTDVYALGVLLYHILTGQTPPPGVAPNLRLKRPDLPLEIERIIMTAMAQYPDQRYASVQDLSNALEAAVSLQPASIPAPPPPIVQAAPQPEQKSASPLIWIGLAVIVILLLAGGFILFSGLLSNSGDEPAAPVPTLPAEQPPAAPEQPVEPAPEQPPVAVIQAPDQAEVGEGVRFDAGASQSTNRIVSYAWEFGDGEGANAVSVRHTYRSPGVYNVILTVTDSNDLSGSSNFQINILESSKQPPVEEPPAEQPPVEPEQPNANE